MTDGEVSEANAILPPQAVPLSRDFFEKALEYYGAGAEGWGDLLDYEKPRVVYLALKFSVI